MNNQDINELLELIKQRRETDERYNYENRLGQWTRARRRLREIIVEVATACFGNASGSLVDYLLNIIMP